MKLYFDYNRITRERIVGSIENLSIDEMTSIPAGFNNNVLWNFGHIAVTQQLLCVKLANQEPWIPEELVEIYRKGSSPKTIKNPAEDLQYFKSNFITLVDLTEESYGLQKLANFNNYKTSYGVELNSIEEAIAFNNLHEALHLGYIMAQKKQL